MDRSRFVFGPFALDRSGSVLRDKAPLEIGQRAMAILKGLLEAEGQTITIAAAVVAIVATKIGRAESSGYAGDDPLPRKPLLVERSRRCRRQMTTARERGLGTSRPAMVPPQGAYRR